MGQKLSWKGIYALQRRPAAIVVTAVVRDLKDVQRGNGGRSLPVRGLVSVTEGCALLG